MKKLICALVSAALAFSLAGCGVQPALPEGEAVQTAAKTTAVDFWQEKSLLIYSRGGVELPVPAEYAERVELEFPEGDGHRRTLFTCWEKAQGGDRAQSGEQVHPGESPGDGWIFSVSRLDQVGFEKWLTEEDGGSYLFAQDSAGGYYLYTYPIDTRFQRPENGMEDAGAWNELNEWGATVPDAILSHNAALREYDVFSLYRRDSLYDGARATVVYTRGGSTEDPVYFELVQPAKQGEGGVWCVERVEYEYTADGWTDTHLVFPAGYGIDMTAADYYARLQTECDAGQHAELLTPMGAALAFARAGNAVSSAQEWDFSLLPTL